MVRTAATQVGFRDQAADAVPQFIPSLFQLLLIRTEINWLATSFDIAARFDWKGDKADARVTIGIGFAAGHGVGNTLLAVEATASGQDHIASRPQTHRGPECLLDGFAATCRPEDLLHPVATRLTLHVGQEPFARKYFDFGRRIVGG